MGGAETWLMAVLRHWTSTGIGAMDFLITSSESGIFDEEARELGARVFYARYGHAHLRSFVGAFRGVLRKGKYTVLHDHQDFASGWHYLMGGDALPPIRITHVHNPAYQIRNNYGVSRRRRLATHLGRWLVARGATHIAGTSSQVLREYGFDAEQFSHLPRFPLYCGFDPERFAGDTAEAKASVCQELGWPQESRIILFAGRMDGSPDLEHPQNHKNSAFAVAVALECVIRDPGVKAIFAGYRSAAASALERRIEEAGASQAVRIVGIRTDIERLMLGSDALLFPSRQEGLGMAAVEAQATGMPVLASRSVPRECVVIDHLVQFLDVSEGTRVWAEELLKMTLRSRDNRSANARVAASPFAISNSSSALLDLYEGRPR